MARAPIAMGAPAPASTPGAAPLIDLSVLDPAMRFAGDASYRAIRALAPIARDAYDTWCVLVLGTCVGLVLGLLFVRPRGSDLGLRVRQKLSELGFDVAGELGLDFRPLRRPELLLKKRCLRELLLL